MKLGKYYVGLFLNQIALIHLKKNKSSYHPNMQTLQRCHVRCINQVGRCLALSQNTLNGTPVSASLFKVLSVFLQGKKNVAQMIFLFLLRTTGSPV